MWQALYERRLWIAALTLLGLGAGVGVAVLVPARFTYASVIEVGMNGNGQDRLEPVPEVLARLTEDYIPRGMRDYAEGHAGRSVPMLSARQPVPMSGALLILESVGTGTEAELHVGVHAAALNLLLAEHEGATRQIRQDLGTQISMLEGAIEADAHAVARLNGQAKDIAASRVRLEATAARLRRQLTPPERPNGKTATDGSSDVTLLLDWQTMQRTLGQLATVETLLYGDTQSEQRSVEEALGEIRRRSTELRTQRDRLRLQLEHVRPTRVISPARRALAPSGRTFFMTVWMATTLGLALGLLVALWPAVIASGKGTPPAA